MEEIESRRLQRENRRLRYSLAQSLASNRDMALQLEKLMFENERLRERTREAQNQMRLMRSSTSWRLGGGARWLRRTAGKLARNARSVLRPGGSQ